MKADIMPVQMPNQRVPIAKQEEEKEALDRYVAFGIMEKVDEPTPWCSIALIRKHRRNFRSVSTQSIMRPLFQIPTLKEHLHKCFSLLGVCEGFLHIPLRNLHCKPLCTLPMADTVGSDCLSAYPVQPRSFRRGSWMHLKGLRV